MNDIILIYVVLGVLVGFILGMVAQMLINFHAISSVKSEMMAIKNQINHNKMEHIEVIEINDHSTANNAIPDYFKKF